MSLYRSLLATGFAGLLVAWMPGLSPADSPTLPDTVSYHTDVRPIFQQHCLGCHQPAKPLGGYVMTSYDELLKQGDRNKPGIVPSQPNQSYLIEQIRVHDGKAEMPKNKPPLDHHSIALISRWVEQGAKDDTPATAGTLVDQDHPPVYQLPPVITAIAFSPDGDTLAVSGYHEVILHTAFGTEILGRLVGLAERIESIAFSPDGKRLAVAGGSPGRFGEVQVWDVDRLALRLSVPVTYDTIYGVSWSHDGTRIAFGCGDNTVRAIDANTGAQVLQQGTHSDWVLDTVFSRESDYLVSVSRDMSMRLTHVPTQRFLDNVTSITPGALKGGLISISRRPIPEKKMAKVPKDTPNLPAKVYDELLAGGSDGVPRLYKMHREVKRVIGDDANRIREYPGMPGRIYSTAFDARGNRFVAGSSLDGTGEIRMYATDSGKQLWAYPCPSPMYAVAFHPEDRMVASAGFDGNIRLHDALNGKIIRTFLAVPMESSPRSAHAELSKR